MNGEFEVISLTPLRKAIAARMTEAKQTIPHYRLTIQVEFDALWSLRRELQAQAPDCQVTLNDLLIKACATALMDVPAVNVQWAGSEIHRYRAADIAVVTAVDGGLLTPVIRGADTKSIWDIAQVARDLSARAARNALKLHEITGGSFSISNLGMYGVDQFDAVINAPQCGILAIGAAKPQLLAGAGGQARVAGVAHMTLSVDHRAIDGVAGAKFLEALKRRVEHPQEAVLGRP